jgi:hypothetical protein
MTTVPFPLIPNAPDVEFRFTIKTARDLERATRHMGGIAGLTLRNNTVEALCALTCYALRWADHKMTEDKAADLIQGFIDGGGDVGVLLEALTKAVQLSGVYGRQEEETSEADPQTATATTTH